MIQVLSMTIAAAAIGTLIRWGIGSSLWGLLLVNATGSLLAGWIAGLNRPDASWSIALVIGFCGALTTFSGFALVSTRLLEQGEFFKLAIHFVLNNALCLLLCYGGWIYAQTR